MYLFWTPPWIEAVSVDQYIKIMPMNFTNKDFYCIFPISSDF